MLKHICKHRFIPIHRIEGVTIKLFVTNLIVLHDILTLVEYFNIINHVFELPHKIIHAGSVFRFWKVCIKWRLFQFALYLWFLVIFIDPYEFDQFYHIIVLEICEWVVSTAIECLLEKYINFIDKKDSCNLRIWSILPWSGWSSMWMEKVIHVISNISLFVNDNLGNLWKCSILDLPNHTKCVKHFFKCFKIPLWQILTVANTIHFIA